MMMKMSGVKLKDSEQLLFPAYSFENTLNVKEGKSFLDGFYKDFLHYRRDYNEHSAKYFPFKNASFYCYKNIEEKFDKNPIPNKVVQGDSGWYFLGDSYNYCIRKSKGLQNFSSKQLEKIKAHWIERKQWVDSLGIPLIIAIAPNKHTAYGRYLNIKQSNRITEFQQYELLGEEIGLNVLNLGQLFSQRINRKPLLYYKEDTHWNDLGAYLGYRALMKRLRGKFPDLEIIDVSELETLNYPPQEKDLSKMLKNDVVENTMYIKMKNPIFSKLDNRLVEPNYCNLLPGHYERRYASSKNHLKALIFRDSYSNALEQFIRESFGESLFIWDPTFDKELIIKEKPDVIILEIVERDLSLLTPIQE